MIGKLVTLIRYIDIYSSIVFFVCVSYRVLLPMSQKNIFLKRLKSVM